MSIGPVSTSNRRARGQVEPVVFWERADGDLMLAPHTLMTPFLGYQKIECQTVSDIERMSKKMAFQEETKMRKMRLEEQLRALPKWDSIIANCKLRLANGCVSKADEALTRNTLASVERKKAIFYTLMAGENSLINGCLEIEKTEAKVGAAQYQQKKVAL